MVLDFARVPCLFACFPSPDSFSIHLGTHLDKRSNSKDGIVLADAKNLDSANVHGQLSRVCFYSRVHLCFPYVRELPLGRMSGRIFRSDMEEHHMLSVLLPLSPALEGRSRRMGIWGISFEYFVVFNCVTSLLDRNQDLEANNLALWGAPCPFSAFHMMHVICHPLCHFRISNFIECLL